MPKEIMRKAYICIFCKKEYRIESDCEEHENNFCFKNKNINWMWYTVKKSFQGGTKKYYFQTTLPVEKWEDLSLLEYIGENTDGGHSYGYRITITSIRKTKPRKINNKYIFELPDYLKAEEK